MDVVSIIMNAQYPYLINKKYNYELVHQKITTITSHVRIVLKSYQEIKVFRFTYMGASTNWKKNDFFNHKRIGAEWLHDYYFIFNEFTYPFITLV